MAEPPQTTGTLIIWEVDTLDRTQQELFLMWMDRQVDLQVISVARDPVFPLVLEGAFLDTLYYRLNIVCLQLSDSRDVQSVPDRCEAREREPRGRFRHRLMFFQSYYEND
jgi:replication-associated recombination protein RarA